MIPSNIACFYCRVTQMYMLKVPIARHIEGLLCTASAHSNSRDPQRLWEDLNAARLQ